MKSPEEIMRELYAHLVYWQRQLRLDGVDIELRWMAKDAEDADTLGLCDAESNSSFYIIHIKHPDHLPERIKDNPFNCDWEVILVHELLHVRDDHWRSDERIWKVLSKGVPQLVYEVGVDAVAEALVRARRGIIR